MYQSKIFPGDMCVYSLYGLGFSTFLSLLVTFWSSFTEMLSKSFIIAESHMMKLVNKMAELVVKYVLSLKVPVQPMNN